MRLYRFLNAKYGMRAIEERQLRISRLLELNDEFEFIGLALKDKADRFELRKMRSHLHKRNGIICMSKNWSHPLLWSHYTDSYRGMALGFEVKSVAFKKIEYVHKRPTLKSFNCKTFNDITPTNIKRLTCMKFAGWSYEDEYRTFQKLENAVLVGSDMHYFLPFSANMKLTSVVVGPRTNLKRKDVIDALRGLGEVEAIQSRASFRDFKIVRNKDQNMWR